MEMTIDDAKYCLENGGLCRVDCKYFSNGRPDCGDNVRKIALDSMAKYQKIQEIMDELDGNILCYLKDRQTLEKIYRVMKDDKI